LPAASRDFPAATPSVCAGSSSRATPGKVSSCFSRCCALPPLGKGKRRRGFLSRSPIATTSRRSGRSALAPRTFPRTRSGTGDRRQDVVALVARRCWCNTTVACSSPAA
jgi:hypothetical protein